MPGTDDHGQGGNELLAFVGLVHVVAVLVMPVSIVFILYNALRNAALMTTISAMIMLVVGVSFEIFFVNFTRVHVVVMSIVIIVKVIDMPFSSMTTLQIVLVTVVMMFMVIIGKHCARAGHQCQNKKLFHTYLQYIVR